MNKPNLRVIVLEPSEWNYANPFGKILSDRRGDKLKIRPTQLIKFVITANVTYD